MAAVVRGLGLWALAALALFLHALEGIPGDYLGQGYPLTPGLMVTGPGLLRDAALATLPIAPVAALAAWAGTRWRGLPLLALPVVALLWLFAAATVIAPFAVDFGNTWSGIEPLAELFLHPVLTPLALVSLLAATVFLLRPSGPAAG